jgi:putative ABC transport system ATP-binding protein
MSLADKKGEKFTLRRLIRKDRIDFYKELLETLDLGLEDKLDTKVKFLSGGQRQSLSLIMATMKHPDLLLLDEHTAALDPKTSHVIMKKTKTLIDKYKMTTIMISHNMKDAIEYSDRIIMLDKGEIILDKRSSEVTELELMEIYKLKLEQDYKSA